FYQQAEARLRDFLKERFLSLPQGLLHEAILLNRSLLKMPYQTEDLNLELSHNLWEFYRGVLEGRPVVLDNTPSRYRIDRTSNLGLPPTDTSDPAAQGKSARPSGPASKSARKRVLLATKVGFPPPTGPQVFSERHIHAAFEGSLPRLQTDNVDLYQPHTPP